MSGKGTPVHGMNPIVHFGILFSLTLLYNTTAAASIRRPTQFLTKQKTNKTNI